MKLQFQGMSWSLLVFLLVINTETHFQQTPDADKEQNLCETCAMQTFIYTVCGYRGKKAGAHVCTRPPDWMISEKWMVSGVERSLERGLHLPSSCTKSNRQESSRGAAAGIISMVYREAMLADWSLNIQVNWLDIGVLCIQTLNHTQAAV